MPDQLNKQSLVNLLIDSPLREPIKINLIDIVNNTTDPDLPKIFPTIVKELEIFQKATERRMKLAEETIVKLGGGDTSPVMQSAAAAVTTTTPTIATTPDTSAYSAPLSPMPATSEQGLTAPTLDLPPLPTLSTPAAAEEVAPLASSPTPLTTEPSAPPVSPVVPEVTPLPTPEPLGGSAPTSQGDEAALAEIQKELDSLKTTTANEISSVAAPTPTSPVAISEAPIAPEA